MSYATNSFVSTDSGAGSEMSFNGAGVQPWSRYPPCVAGILQRNRTSRQQSPPRRPELHQTLRNTEISPSSPSCSNNPCQQFPNRPSSRGLTTEQLATLSELSELKRIKNVLDDPQEKAVCRLHSASQSLVQIRDGMVTTIQEYFPGKFSWNHIHIRAYPNLRKALDNLITTLQSFAAAITKPFYYRDVLDVSWMLVQVREALDDIIEEGEMLLRNWNRREGGQVIGQPLKGKSRTLRQISILDCNERLYFMTKKVIEVETRLQQEQRSREPQNSAKVEHRKRAVCLKYIGFVKKTFGAQQSSSRDAHHKEEEHEEEHEATHLVAGLRDLGLEAEEQEKHASWGTQVMNCLH